MIPDRPWLFQHSEWFQPYVAGYYAYVMGIEVSREHVEARLEAYLQMGQPWLYQGA